MLRFSLANLEIEANKDNLKFIALLKQHYLNPPIKTIKTKLSLAGFSFLLNPAPILNYGGHDISYKVQYVKLAAKRDYSLYKFFGVKSLDLSFWPDVDINNIKHNPLIKIANNHIYFKFEE